MLVALFLHLQLSHSAVIPFPASPRCAPLFNASAENSDTAIYEELKISMNPRPLAELGRGDLINALFEFDAASRAYKNYLRTRRFEDLIFEVGEFYVSYMWQIRRAEVFGYGDYALASFEVKERILAAQKLQRVYSEIFVAMLEDRVSDRAQRVRIYHRYLVDNAVHIQEELAVLNLYLVEASEYDALKNRTFNSPRIPRAQSMRDGRLADVVRSLEAKLREFAQNLNAGVLEDSLPPNWPKVR